MTSEALLEHAAQARLRAYAPYSKFSVGAALLARNGVVSTGCNIENISFGLTICAERVAAGSAVADGLTDFAMLAIVSDSEEPILPCGACRQVLAEFSPDLRIVSGNLKGSLTEFGLAALLPNPRQGILG